MIVGISGKMEAGKNEVADMLSYLLFINPEGNYQQFEKQRWLRNAYISNGSYLEAQFKLPNIHSFANNLKKCTAICTGIDYHELEKRAVKASKIDWLGLTHRQLLQQFAAAIRGQINENFWILSMFATYQDSDFWLISDVRYKNEADAIRERSGIVIRIDRPMEHNDSHISETNLDDYPYFTAKIINDGTLEDLFEAVKRIIPIIKLAKSNE